MNVKPIQNDDGTYSLWIEAPSWFDPQIDRLVEGEHYERLAAVARMALAYGPNGVEAALAALTPDDIEAVSE